MRFAGEQNEEIAGFHIEFVVFECVFIKLNVFHIVVFGITKLFVRISGDDFFFAVYDILNINIVFVIFKAYRVGDFAFVLLNGSENLLAVNFVFADFEGFKPAYFFKPGFYVLSQRFVFQCIFYVIVNHDYLSFFVM